MFQTTLLTSLSLQNGGRVDYEDLLNQKRRDEARYRYGGQSGGFQQANLRSANSEGFLNNLGNSGGFNQQLEDLSQAVSSQGRAEERRGDMMFVMFPALPPAELRGPGPARCSPVFLLPELCPAWPAVLPVSPYLVRP